MPDIASLSTRVAGRMAHPPQLVVSGPLDVTTTDELQRVLHRELAARGQLLLDLSAVTSMNSCGIRVIVWAIKLARRNGWSFGIRDEMPEHVREVFQTAGLEPFLPLTA